MYVAELAESLAVSSDFVFKINQNDLWIAKSYKHLFIYKTQMHVRVT